MSLYEYCAQNLTASDAEQLYVQSLLYLSGATPAFTFQHNVKKIDTQESHGLSGKSFRLKLLEKDYYIVQVKFALLQYGTCSAKKARANAEKFLDEEELMNFDRVLTRRVINILRGYCKAKAITAAMVAPSMMVHHRARFDSMIETLNVHIKRKVYKKLTFVVKSQNGEHKDFFTDLLCRALTAYYQLIPTNKSDAYVLNYLRRTCTNCALNIIETNTTQKNGRMVRSGEENGRDKFTLVCESENQGTDIGEDGPLSINERGYEEDQSMLHIVKLMERFSGWRRKAILVMCGMSQGFSLYLQRLSKINETQDHQDFQNRVSRNTYLEYVAKFCGATQNMFAQFVENLGKMLAHGEPA